jgi:hypothetical protein
MFIIGTWFDVCSGHVMTKLLARAAAEVAVAGVRWQDMMMAAGRLAHRLIIYLPAAHLARPHVQTTCNVYTCRLQEER